MTAGEKRRFHRHPFLAEIKYRSDSPPVTGRITDLSEGGMFVDTITPLLEDSEVRFAFYLPDNYPDIAVTGSGKVAWIQFTIGMGIEFLQLDERSQARLKKFLDAL